MVAIAERVRGRRSRFEFVFDRPQVLGSAFLAPAILYVLVLVGIPFLLAVYYALSAYTVYKPSYHFVGLRNFIEVVQSEIFRRTLLNTFIFTIGSQILGLILGKFGALLLLRPCGRGWPGAAVQRRYFRRGSMPARFAVFSRPGTRTGGVPSRAQARLLRSSVRDFHRRPGAHVGSCR
jgi:hypothetical protein